MFDHRIEETLSEMAEHARHFIPQEPSEITDEKLTDDEMEKITYRYPVPPRCPVLIPMEQRLKFLKSQRTLLLELEATERGIEWDKVKDLLGW
jgi:hypothetical protein